MHRRVRGRLMMHGKSAAEAEALLSTRDERPEPNWWILGGGLAFVIFTIGVGLSPLKYAQEIIFVGSFAIVCFLMAKLTRALDPVSRETLIGTAIVIFVFRAVPGPGPGIEWWMIDHLRFDQEF